ncbi:MAG: hypothetical protein LUH40_05910 [Clostridiales bacterium]|nr:hypothetical protein [Clostridiales bacterium]
MIEQGMTVLYGSHGVCRVEGKVVQNLSNGKHEYYVLKPVYQASSTLFIPTDSEQLLSTVKEILSPDEIDDLLHSVKDEEPQWIENENIRKQSFSEILASGDRFRILMLIKSVYKHKTEVETAGKSFIKATKSPLKRRKSSCMTSLRYLLISIPPRF